MREIRTHSDPELGKQLNDFITCPELYDMDKAILVWEWDKAPDVLKENFNDGGDEDWICLIPPAVQGEYLGEDYLPFWMERMASCDPIVWKTENGWLVVVGVH